MISHGFRLTALRLWLASVFCICGLLSVAFALVAPSLHPSTHHGDARVSSVVPGEETAHGHTDGVYSDATDDDDGDEDGDEDDDDGDMDDADLVTLTLRSVWLEVDWPREQMLSPVAPHIVSSKGVVHKWTRPPRQA